MATCTCSIRASGFGYPQGTPTPPVQIFRVTPNGQPPLVYSNATSPGLTSTALGIAVRDEDTIFVNDANGMQRVRRDGRVEHFLDLPTKGDHNADHIVFGKDGKLYWTQGSATNSGVVGADNQTATMWLANNPTFRDIPCRDVILSGEKYKSENPLTEDPSDTVVTGPFLPFGTAGTAGQVIPGQVPCTLSVLRANIDGSGLELVAWGFRNPFGLAFSPEDSALKGALVVTNNGSDVRGSREVEGDADDLYVIVPGGWYGWPDVLDGLPSIEARFSPSSEDRRGVEPALWFPAQHEAIGAIAQFQKGVSADGLDFSTSDAFGWKGDAFVATWGSLGFGAQQPEGLPGFNVMHVHFSTSNGGVLAGASAAPFLRNRVQGAASTTSQNGLEHPVDVKFSADGSTMYVLDFGVAGRPGSGKIWAVRKR